MTDGSAGAVERLIDTLCADPETAPLVAHVEKIPGKEAVYGTIRRPLPDPLDAFLADRAVRLYRHQAEAVEAIRDGESIILTTPTASGKSLAFNLPVFERLIRSPDACALYLYPTKALANDQFRSIREIEAFSGIGTASAIYDGDTPAHRRPAIRERARIVLSNPHELHHILPWHHTWRRFFAGLSFVIIDEAHRYRGVTGSHMAFLIRRLRRIAALYGSAPQFILATATIANPAEFAGRLTGLPARVIDGDGAPSAGKYFLFYNPFAAGRDRSAHLATRDLVAACVRHDLQTLCFTVSRRMAELIGRWSQTTLAGEAGSGAVATYRAGYLPELRREIEGRLKEGSLRAVVSTNALEVGIDVGTLDAVVTSGYPGTMMAAWQQAGRAGRRGGASLAALVAFQNPLDQYFMHHPDAFFGRPNEHAIVDLGNPYITAGHLLCAASEAPLPEPDCTAFFGDVSPAILASLEGAGLIRTTPRGAIYAGRGRATEAVPLGAVTADTFRVVCRGELIETMDRGQAFREAHPGAVLLHEGETYVVEDLDLEACRIRVRREEVDYHTEAVKQTDIAILREIGRKAADGMRLCFGEVEVTERTCAYRVRHRDTSITTCPLDLPATRFATRALWWVPDEKTCGAVREQGFDLAGGLHGCEHVLIAMTPFQVMCDRWDLGGLSTPFFASLGGPVVMVYDGYEGGIGLTEKAYELFDGIAAAACRLVADCGCDAGCPACIYSPKCGSDNRPLDKEATRLILRRICERSWGEAA